GNYDDGKTGYDFAKWLVDFDLDTDTMPEDFKFTIHSKNPIGSENIRKLLEGYIRDKNGVC
ncbi:MAG TPA: cyclic-phosphate processing receiver domain-containing protein, partial [Ignavibacteriaceae bacterium]